MSEVLSSHICANCIFRIQGCEVNTNEGIQRAGSMKVWTLAATCMNTSRGVPIKAC